MPTAATVVAVATVDVPPMPAWLEANTWKSYCVDCCRPVTVVLGVVTLLLNVTNGVVPVILNCTV
jgi:hypothetical protein